MCKFRNYSGRFFFQVEYKITDLKVVNEERTKGNNVVCFYIAKFCKSTKTDSPKRSWKYNYVYSIFMRIIVLIFIVITKTFPLLYSLTFSSCRYIVLLPLTIFRYILFSCYSVLLSYCRLHFHWVHICTAQPKHWIHNYHTHKWMS